MTGDVDLIDDGRAPEEPRWDALAIRAVWVRPLLLAAVCAALALPALSAPERTPPTSPVTRSSACVNAELDSATAARVRAREVRRAQIRAVPTAYRDAARRAASYTHRRIRPEFFLALAYNRTLYGAMLTNPAARPYARRGPVQWDLRKFSAVAVPGHRDAARATDSFLAVAAALRRAGAADGDDAFDLSLLLGSTPDQARADAEAFDVLTAEPASATPVGACAGARNT